MVHRHHDEGLHRIHILALSSESMQVIPRQSCAALLVAPGSRPRVITHVVEPGGYMRHGQGLVIRIGAVSRQLPQGGQHLCDVSQAVIGTVRLGPTANDEQPLGVPQGWASIRGDCGDVVAPLRASLRNRPWCQ